MSSRSTASRFSALIRQTFIVLVVALSAAALARIARADEFIVETAFPTNAAVAQWQTSIALDAEGNPHVSHTGEFAGAGVWYSHKANGVWVHECVHTLWATSYSSIALDAGGSPHISYQAGPEFDLHYARRENGAWVIEVADRPVNPSGDVGNHSSIALDAAGDVHVAYGETGFRVKYARRSAGTWSAEYVSGASQASSISMALDSNGNPRVSYNEISAGVVSLRYARKVSGNWIYETPEGGTGNIVGVGSRIAVDGIGRAHIAHYDATAKVLKYARKLVAIWVTEVVDGDGIAQTGRDCDIALDAAGAPCISYQHDATSVSPDLRFARKLGGGWVITTVDAGPNAVGRWTSLALDATGNPHISYEDRSTADLKYASGVLTTSVPLPPAGQMALTVAPNPAGATGALVAYRLPEGADATLAIFDASGRRVATLAERLRARAGGADGSVVWDATDARGDRVASGAYFLRLTSGDASRTERLVIVR